MTLPNLVSFSGYSWSGKDAAADLMVSRVRFTKTYMQKPLEQALLKANPWIVDRKESTVERFADLHENLGFDETRTFDEVRRLLSMGAEIGRDLLGQNIWNDLVFTEVQNLLALGKKVALSGVSYPDELALVRENGGVCVWINRYRARPGGTSVTAEDCDLVVDNVGTLKDFYVALITTLEEYTPTNEEK